MKHKTATNQRIANLMSQNQSLENYFSEHAISKNSYNTISKNYSKSPYVVEWQMENDKQDI